MSTISTHIDKGGRIVIPAELRRLLQLEPGDSVFLAWEGESVRILSQKQALDHARRMLRPLAKGARAKNKSGPGKSGPGKNGLGKNGLGKGGLVDDFLKARRDEVSRERLT